jgi:hypothetical protein
MRWAPPVPNGRARRKGAVTWTRRLYGLNSPNRDSLRGGMPGLMSGAPVGSSSAAPVGRERGSAFAVGRQLHWTRRHSGLFATMALNVTRAWEPARMSFVNAAGSGGSRRGPSRGLKLAAREGLFPPLPANRA